MHDLVRPRVMVVGAGPVGHPVSPPAASIPAQALDVCGGLGNH
ncbi:hypothetical protein [Streptomyces sp. NWU339]|nr:hypothetical protein [Streptomyces sp. NWU339]